MSFRVKLTAKIAEIDLTSERREMADAFVKALCDELEQEDADSHSVEEALRQTMAPSLDQAADIVSRAKDMTS